MKKLISVVLVLVLSVSALVLPASAFTKEELDTADAMYSLGLFLGTGDTYDLDGKLTRAQGITLLVRMLGKEEAALAGDAAHPFNDVPEWAAPYVAYAYANGLTKGYSGEYFGAADAMTEAQFLTLTLRALGYSDSGEAPAFSWDAPFALAKTAGLIADETAKETFRRADAVMIFWNALQAKVQAEENATLSDSLVKQGTYTSGGYQKATNIRTSGRTEEDGTGEKAAPRGYVSWPEYKAMTPDEQVEFIASFASGSAYEAWRKNAVAEYEASRNVYHFDSNQADLSELFGN